MGSRVMCRNVWRCGTPAIARITQRSGAESDPARTTMVIVTPPQPNTCIRHVSTKSCHKFSPTGVGRNYGKSSSNMDGRGVARPKPPTLLYRHPHHHHEPKDDRTIVPRAKPLESPNNQEKIATKNLHSNHYEH
ncbi:hypothetical protein ACFX16_006108 [Malus domestica]